MNFVIDNKGKKIAVQIDMKWLKKNTGQIGDVIEIIIAEGRKDDEDVS